MQKVLVTVEFIKPALVNAGEFFGALQQSPVGGWDRHRASDVAAESSHAVLRSFRVWGKHVQVISMLPSFGLFVI